MDPLWYVKEHRSALASLPPKVLTVGERHLLSCLILFADDEDVARVSRYELALLAGMDVESIRSLLGRLRAKGILGPPSSPFRFPSGARGYAHPILLRRTLQCPSEPDPGRPDPSAAFHGPDQVLGAESVAEIRAGAVR